MKNQDNFFTALRFVVGLAFLGFGLMQFSLALTYRPLDNHFPGGVLGIPLALLLTLLFGIGWWLEWFFEKMIPNKGRNVMILVLSGVIIVYLVVALISFLMPLGFSRFALVAGDSIVLSGFWLQLSRIRPETLAKMRNHA